MSVSIFYTSIVYINILCINILHHTPKYTEIAKYIANYLCTRTYSP